MGIYPVSPADPFYTITTPRFDKITIHLDPRYYKNETLVIEKVGHGNGKINHILIDGKKHKGYFIDHSDLVNGKTLKVILE